MPGSAGTDGITSNYIVHNRQQDAGENLTMLAPAFGRIGHPCEAGIDEPSCSDESHEAAGINQVEPG